MLNFIWILCENQCYSFFVCFSFFKENSLHFATAPLVFRKMTPEKRAQELHTDNASVTRFWWCFWSVVPRGKFSSTNQKHYPDLDSDASSVWNSCVRFSVVASRNVGCFLRLVLLLFVSFVIFEKRRCFNEQQTFLISEGLEGEIITKLEICIRCV